jgi:hypothetical protein
MFHDPQSVIRAHEQRVDAAARRRAQTPARRRASQRDAPRASPRPGAGREEVLVAPTNQVLSQTAFRLLHRINTMTDDAASTTPTLRAVVGMLIAATAPASDVDRLLPRPTEPPVLVASLASRAIRHADERTITVALALLESAHEAPAVPDVRAHAAMAVRARNEGPPPRLPSLA